MTLLQMLTIRLVYRWRSSLPSKVRNTPVPTAFLDIGADSPPVVQHMQTYWSILEKVKGSTLRLTKMDDDIYDHLKEAFPEFDPAATINEDEMKSKTGKERWRAFMMAYEKKIEDYNFGTMVRNSAKVEYDEDTAIFGEPGLRVSILGLLF